MSERAKALLRSALEHRRAQRMEEALAAVEAAAALAPDDPAIALAHARLAYETWRDAAALFERALRLAPDVPDAIVGLAGALVAERRAEEADALLERALGRHPEWCAGHRQLAMLRSVAGRDDLDASFAAACRARPDDLALRLAWFQTLVAARRWAAARRVIRDAVAAFGEQTALSVARAFLASESDEASRDPRLFDALDGVDDVGLDLCRVRFWLRNGRPECAAAIAETRIGAAPRTFWPYLALASRLLDGRRAAWLDRDPAWIAQVELGLSQEALARLAAVLDALLADGGRYPGQSVRGGVQTGRNLFFHPAPEIQDVRRRATDAVAAYVAALPPAESAHPLLEPRRDEIRYEGAWSVRLDPRGHHAPHTHAMGWISSALHVALPAPAPAAPEAGALGFGAAPAELGLTLPPTRTIVPRAGRLALFPATTWHATLPFEAGRRLTLAFDVRVPEGRGQSVSR